MGRPTDVFGFVAFTYIFLADNEEGLTGYLYIHVQNGKSFSRTAGKTQVCLF